MGLADPTRPRPRAPLPRRRAGARAQRATPRQRCAFVAIALHAPCDAQRSAADREAGCERDRASRPQRRALRPRASPQRQRSRATLQRSFADTLGSLFSV